MYQLLVFIALLNIFPNTWCMGNPKKQESSLRSFLKKASASLPTFKPLVESLPVSKSAPALASTISPASLLPQEIDSNKRFEIIDLLAEEDATHESHIPLEKRELAKNLSRINETFDVFEEKELY